MRVQLNAEAEAVHIILTWIDNDIYSTVDACPNACEMWKAVERLKQGDSINVQDLELILLGVMFTISSSECPVLTSTTTRMAKATQNEVNEIRAERLARMLSTDLNRGKAIVNSSAPTYDPKPDTVTKDDEMSKDKEIDKLIALISLSIKKNLQTTCSVPIYHFTS
ncbi:hypothetical protein Tco_0723553 [Tanacetum coccineum]